MAIAAAALATNKNNKVAQALATVAQTPMIDYLNSIMTFTLANTAKINMNKAALETERGRLPPIRGGRLG